MKHIILGSGSLSRKAILSEAGISFTAVAADIDERAIGNRSSAEYAQELVLSIARAKADCIIQKLPEDLPSRTLLTADTVVTHNNKIIEKPRSQEEARENYKSYGLYPCSLVSGIVLTDVVTGSRVEGVDVATVRFKPFSDDAVEKIIEEGKLFKCAGGIMIENPLVSPFIDSIDGNEDTIRGLSIELSQRLFRQLYAQQES